MRGMKTVLCVLFGSALLLVGCAEPQMFQDEELPLHRAPIVSFARRCHSDEPPGVSQERQAACRQLKKQLKQTTDNAARYELECKAWMAYPTPGCCDIPGANTPSHFNENNAALRQPQLKYARMMEQQATQEDSLLSLFTFLEFPIQCDGEEEEALRHRQKELMPRYLARRDEFRRTVMERLYPMLATLPDIKGEGTEEEAVRTLQKAPCRFGMYESVFDDCSDFDFDLCLRRAGGEPPLFLHGSIDGWDYPRSIPFAEVSLSHGKGDKTYTWKDNKWKLPTERHNTFYAEHAVVERRNGIRLLTVYDHRGNVAERFVLWDNPAPSFLPSGKSAVKLRHVRGYAYRLVGDETRRYCSLLSAEAEED